jgi:hypothetical protein
MTTVFKVGDVLVDVFGRERGTVIAVEGEHVCFRNRLGHMIGSKRVRLSRDFVSRTAPPTFASCTDPGTPPACVNEVPKPTRLEAARAALNEAVQSPHALTGHTTRALVDELIAAAKAEAIAQREAREPKPYGRVLATVSATCDYRHRKGDDVEMTFTVLVPAHAAIACAPIHETNYRVTATSKGER